MKIGIVGYGVVGSALGSWLKKHTDHEIKIYDPKVQQDDLSDVELGFIAVPAPTKKHGLDLSIVNEAIDRLPDVPIFIRTTVLPGVCDMLRKEKRRAVYAMPEFLTERTAQQCFDKHDIITAYAGDLSDVFPGKKIHVGTNVECEMAKYMNNINGAIQVTMFNMFYEMCERYGADYKTAVDLASKIGYLKKRYSKVPGPDGRFGFGGKCFPKDIKSFNQLIKSKFLSAVIQVNDLYRSKHVNKKIAFLH